MSLSLRARQSTPNQGRCVYLFNNIRTNQVIYSLTEKIAGEARVQHRLLDQLTFYGKNTKPTSIRKDHWKHLATVHFPKPEYGLLAFQWLREYRKARDYAWSWDPSHTKLPSQKERRWMLMDQKATSVADLADVLERQDEQIQKKAKEDDLKAQNIRQMMDRQWQKLVDLEKAARAGGLEKVEQQLRNLEKLIEKTEAKGKKRRQQKALLNLRRQRNRLITATEAVDFVNDTAEVSFIRRRNWNQNLRAIVQSRTSKPVIGQPPTPVEEQTSTLEDATKDAAILNPTTNSTSNSPTSATEQNQTETEEAVEKEEQEEDPLVSRSLPPSSILIQWASLYDAEYAAQWPQKVFHEQVAKPLNVTRVEERQMEEGAVLDDEASEEGGKDVEGDEDIKEGENVKEKGEGEGEGEGKGKGDGEGEREGEKKGRKWALGRLVNSLPGIGRSTGEARQ